MGASARKGSRRGTRQAGVTLLDMVMVTAFAATVLFGGVFLYHTAVKQARLQKIEQQLMGLSATVRDLAAVSGRYHGITRDQIVTLNAVPADMVQDGTILHVFGGQVDIAGGADCLGAGRPVPIRFCVELQDLPRAACIQLVQRIGLEGLSGRAAEIGPDYISPVMGMAPIELANLYCTAENTTVRMGFN